MTRTSRVCQWGDTTSTAVTPDSCSPRAFRRGPSSPGSMAKIGAPCEMKRVGALLMAVSRLIQENWQSRGGHETVPTAGQAALLGRFADGDPATAKQRHYGRRNDQVHGVFPAALGVGKDPTVAG